ncbi:MAG: hypothetical protein RLY82_1598 [Pseudomonadota bacterium]
MKTIEAPMLALGSTWHCRTAPARNVFKYSVYFLMLPMRAMRHQHALEAPSVLARNRWGLLSFYDADHGLGSPDALAWIESLLEGAGVPRTDGEIWLQTFPRVLGYAFKPISIWYVLRGDDSLAAAVVEVNNTFGQRHIYLLAGQDVAWNTELVAQKVFHVSPFCDIKGTYQFRFTKSAEHIAAYITHDILQTHWIGITQPFTKQVAWRAFLSSPLMTFGIVARIHWQAAKLWWKKTPFYKLPKAPAEFVT